MTDLNCLLQSAKRHYQQVCAAPAGSMRAAVPFGDACPALWKLQELLSLLDERHDEPATHLTPLVRRVLTEQTFIDENGDGVIDDMCRIDIDRQVRLIVTVLERVRIEALEHGWWSEVSQTEQWVG